MLLLASMMDTSPGRCRNSVTASMAKYGRLMLQAYQVGYTSPEANAGVVQRLLDTRQQIAELLDAPSYSHYQAGRDTLAEHPAAVTTFLQGECHSSHAQQPVSRPHCCMQWGGNSMSHSLLPVAITAG